MTTACAGEEQEPASALFESVGMVDAGESTRRESFGAGVGGKVLVLEFHALLERLVADVALDADDHAGLGRDLGFFGCDPPSR